MTISGAVSLGYSPIKCILKDIYETIRGALFEFDSLCYVKFKVLAYVLFCINGLVLIVIYVMTTGQT